MREKDNILLIDADSLIYYEAFKETLIEALEGIDERMERIFKETGSNKYIAFLTPSGCFRYDRAYTKDYKGSRKDKKKAQWFNAVKAYLIDKYGAIYIPKLEADDCVAWLSNNNLFHTIVCSPDKDVLKQCPGRHYNYQMESKGTYKSKGFIETSKAEAKNFLFTQLLMGDSTDGISGIEGVGPAKATRILECEIIADGTMKPEEVILSNYTSKYGLVDGISRFAEAFKLIYLLKTDEDMLREIGYIPEIPEILEYKKDKEEDVEISSWD
jgi:hypothetical protein